MRDGQWFRGKPVKLLSEVNGKKIGYIWDQIIDESGETKYIVKVGNTSH
jgi:uncharacterized protein YrrD